MKNQRPEVLGGGKRAAGDRDALDSGVVWVKYIFKLHDVSSCDVLVDEECWW